MAKRTTSPTDRKRSPEAKRETLNRKAVRRFKRDNARKY